MGMEDQTKNDFLEALSEIIDRFHESVKRKFSDKEVNEKQDDFKDLSPQAKELLETLKKNPEEAKEIIAEATKNKIEQSSDSFKDNNKEAFDQVQGMKLNINFESENANDVLQVMNKYESIILKQSQKHNQLLEKKNELKLNVKEKEKDKLKDKELLKDNEENKIEKDKREEKQKDRSHEREEMEIER